MTRGEMRTLVRDAILDEDTSNPHWSDAKIDRRLNLDAKYVARMLDRLSLIHTTAGNETFTTSNNTRAYALSASNIRKIYAMWQLDDNSEKYRPCRQIPESLSPEGLLSYKDGKWLYYVTRNPTTKAWTINFPNDPGVSYTFSVDFSTNIAEIATGSGNDGDEYTQIPEEFHELVVARTAMKLVGRDHSHYERIMAEYLGLEEELVIDAQQGASPREIAQEW